jgi:hypothetical protein
MGGSRVQDDPRTTSRLKWIGRALMAGGGLLLAVAIGSLFLSDDDRGGNRVSAGGPRVVRIQDDAHAYDLDADGTLDSSGSARPSRR